MIKLKPIHPEENISLSERLISIKMIKETMKKYQNHFHIVEALQKQFNSLKTVSGLSLDFTKEMGIGKEITFILPSNNGSVRFIEVCRKLNREKNEWFLTWANFTIC